MPKRSKHPPCEYDTIPYKSPDGVRYTVFLCARCARAWKLRDPVESWRVKTLVTHFTSHRADAVISDMMADVPAHAKRGDVA